MAPKTEKKEHKKEINHSPAYNAAYQKHFFRLTRLFTKGLLCEKRYKQQLAYLDKKVYDRKLTGCPCVACQRWIKFWKNVGLDGANEVADFMSDLEEEELEPATPLPKENEDDIWERSPEGLSEMLEEDLAFEQELKKLRSKK